MKKIIVIGATSAIAEATARIWAARGDELFIVGRNQDHLNTIKDDLKVRGSPAVSSYQLDINQLNLQSSMLDEAFDTFGVIDIVLIAHGTLSDQQACETSVDLTLQEITTNALSTVALLTQIANRLEKQGSGTVAVISSVAGERGRQSNYVYGSAKAMITTFTSGLRQRLYKSGVSVLTIKPGFVDTPMTIAFKKGVLWASASRVALEIAKACDAQKNVIYTPKFWCGIMLIIKLIPECVFKRLKL